MKQNIFHLVVFLSFHIVIKIFQLQVDSVTLMNRLDTQHSYSQLYTTFICHSHSSIIPSGSIKTAAVGLLSFFWLCSENKLSHWYVQMWKSQSPSLRMLGKLLDHFLTVNNTPFNRHLTGHCKLLLIGIQVPGMRTYVCLSQLTHIWLVVALQWILVSALQSQITKLPYPREQAFPLLKPPPLCTRFSSHLFNITLHRYIFTHIQCRQSVQWIAHFKITDLMSNLYWMCCDKCCLVVIYRHSEPKSLYASVESLWGPFPL